MHAAEWTAAIAAVATTIVTLIYAIFTYRIVIANQRLVAVTERQIRLQTRPYIFVRAITRPASPVFQLSISNVGKSIARNVTFYLSRDIYQFAEKTERRHLNSQGLFNSTYEAFAPGTELVIDLGRSWDVVDSDEALCPAKFTIRCRYSCDDENFEEITAINLEMYRPTSLGNYGLIHEIHELGKSVGELCDIGKQLATTAAAEPERNSRRSTSPKYRISTQR